MQEPCPGDVIAAHEIIAPHIVRTPTLRSAALDAETGATVLVKAEPLQRTGSFKLRGATHALLRLSEDERRHGVVTYSSGNHGQALACAAARFGVTATIVMPEDAPRVKRDATAAWGAEIITYDRRTGDREAIGRDIAARTGAALIPPYDHPDVIAGQGTLALELAEDAEALDLRLDAFLVCTGGGGLTAGCALALADRSPGTRVYGVEPEGWDDTCRSLERGERVRNDGNGSPLCDALLSPTPGELTFPINKHLLAGAFRVSDEEVLSAMRFALTHLKIVVEPGGAVALAALRAGRLADCAGQTIGVVLSGGNADLSAIGKALSARS